MLYLTEFHDFRKFLSFVFVEVSKNKKQSENRIFEYSDKLRIKTNEMEYKMDDHNFWHEILASYIITKIFFLQNLDDYATAEITMQNTNGLKVFQGVDSLLLDRNYGIMIINFDGKGSIDNLDMSFKVEKKLPAFLIELITAFPGSDQTSDKNLIERIKKIGTRDIHTFCGS